MSSIGKSSQDVPFPDPVEVFEMSNLNPQDQHLYHLPLSSNAPYIFCERLWVGRWVRLVLI